MSVLKPSYGSNNQTISITATSLSTGGARQCTILDNTSNLYDEILVFVKIKSGASATATTGIVNIYAFGSADGGTTYTENAGAADAAITLTVPPNARLIGVVNVVANAVTYYGGPFAVSPAFGGVIPDHWGIIIENQSGGTLDGTIATAWYQGIQLQIV